MSILTSSFSAKAARQHQFIEAHPDILMVPQSEVKGLRTAINAMNQSQVDYFKAMGEQDILFGLGPAGTGKTYLAVARGVCELLLGNVERLIIGRPAVEAGEYLGFLPGNEKEKVDPYMRPAYDALHDLLSPEAVETRMAKGEIEVAPIGFLRGRTLKDAFIVIDEAQNLTMGQMKMVLTRLGWNSTMVVCGDPDQCDLPLPVHERNGLQDAIERHERSEAIGIHRFDVSHVVRHPTVATVLNNYQKQLPNIKPISAPAAIPA